MKRLKKRFFWYSIRKVQHRGRAFENSRINILFILSEVSHSRKIISLIPHIQVIGSGPEMTAFSEIVITFYQDVEGVASKRIEFNYLVSGTYPSLKDE